MTVYKMHPKMLVFGLIFKNVMSSRNLKTCVIFEKYDRD